jgi:hypothetical protein
MSAGIGRRLLTPRERLTAIHSLREHSDRAQGIVRRLDPQHGTLGLTDFDLLVATERLESEIRWLRRYITSRQGASE